jgi:hypothetical protein
MKNDVTLMATYLLILKNNSVEKQQFMKHGCDAAMCAYNVILVGNPSDEVQQR